MFLGKKSESSSMGVNTETCQWFSGKHLISKVGYSSPISETNPKGGLCEALSQCSIFGSSPLDET